jgi:hypothetical protein
MLHECFANYTWRKYMGSLNVSRVRAFYVFNHLIITVEGMKPSPGHKVGIEILLSFPPQYSVVTTPPEGIVIWVMTPFRYVKAFSESYRPTIKVYVGDEPTEVNVERLDPSEEQSANLLQANVTNTFSADRGDPAPFRIKDLFGDATPSIAIAEPREATGYSDNFSIEEAFQNAIKNLPEPTETYPDQLFAVSISEIGALFGGFVGYTGQLYVKVRG